jgi:FO synthase subunit 2
VILETVLEGVRAPIRRALEGCLEGRALSVEGAVELSSVVGIELHALSAVADAMRAREVGEVVTYVVNRNINFTNVCIKSCAFCAFARGVRSEQGYLLPTEEVVRRVLEARAFGATEVCLQAGLAPDVTGTTYLELLRAVKRAAPDVHVHAFSPEEVKYGAAQSRLSIGEYLTALREAGLGSLPGTSAEILDDDLRARIAPTRIRTGEWIEVITTAHRLGIPTTSTMMFGHVESAPACDHR